MARTASCVPLAVALLGAMPARHTPRPTTPPTPAYAPPPSEESPFSHPDRFCVANDDQFDTTTTSDPQVRAQPVVVVWLADAAAGTTPSGSDHDIETFARLVDQCGGIAGRPFVVHVVHSSGDPVTDCAAVARFHPVAVVAPDLVPAAACVVHDQSTVLVTGVDVSNADLAGTSGRLVATGSDEGVDPARLLALVSSGRLAGHRVAIVAAPDAAGAEFRRATLAVLAAQRIRPVALANADIVLTSHLDPAALSALDPTVDGTGHVTSRDVYDLAPSDPALPAAMDAQPLTARRLLRTMRVFSFPSLTDPAYLAGRPPNGFAQMCTRAAADAPTAIAAKGGGVTTSTTEARPPLAASYLDTAKACLLTRIVARGLFAAGPSLDQRALITALHRLPYVDQVAPAGTAKPRPNQIVNEPARRIEQTVVLDQLGTECPVSDAVTTTTGSMAPLCWSSATGWDEGGRVVNVPLPASTAITR